MCKATPALSHSISWYHALLSLRIILLCTLEVNWEQSVSPCYMAKSKNDKYKFTHHQEMIIQLWNWDRN